MTDIDPKNRDVHGNSKIIEVPKKKGMNWLPWAIGAVLLLGVLLLLLRGCGHNEPAPVANTVETTTTTTTNTVGTGPATPAVGIEKVTLPGGRVVDLEPKTLNYELQRYLASSEAAPRKFTFDHLNFATDSAELPVDAQATVGALAQILSAYPKARVELQGYADSTGSEAHNVQLGAERAAAVEKGLVAQGVSADRIKTATGGEANPIDTNATNQGRAGNRRTELVVTAK